MVVNDFRLIANSADITAIIRERLVSLRCSDSAGFDSDSIEIVLADHDPDHPIELPPTGAELELFLGTGSTAQRMGLYVVDEVELAGWPGTLTIRAKAAPFEESKQGKSQLQTQKSRTWTAGTKLVDVVRKIAAEHSLTPVIASSLSKITLPMMAQTDESDISFLTRVARRYDAVCKPADGKLVLTRHGEGKTASGAEIPAVTIRAQDVTSFTCTTSRREDSGTVVAYWHETKAGKRNEVKVGSGEPVKRLKMYFPSQQTALDAATSELRRRERGGTRLSIRMPGNPAVFAEAPIALEGFRDGVDERWICSRVEHTLDAGGFVTSIEAEQPNAEDAPNVETAST